MKTSYSANTEPNIYSAEGRDQYAQDMFGIDKKFSREVQPFIDRMNRKGAGMVMHLKRTPDGQVIEATFLLARDLNVSITAELVGGILSYANTLYASRDDFSRLIPKMARDLAIKSLQQAYEPPAGPRM